MITKDKYLEALEIVEQYHFQIKEDSIPHKLTHIEEWDKIDYCSRRLRNILFDIMHKQYKWINYNEKFIEKIDLNKMKKFRNCGVKTLREFKYLRGY